MRNSVALTEHGCLTTAVVAPSLEQRTISQADFEWLCQVGSTSSGDAAPLFRLEAPQRLRVNNYVGVLETPSSTIIEVLPKHHEEGASIEETRRLLYRMILGALELPARDIGQAYLSLFDAPLSEWVARQFLDALDRLLKRGLRFDYLRKEEEQRHLRGQLDMARQLRQPPGREHYFQVRHDVFSPDRPENRLLKSALALVASCTRHAENWRLAHELLGMLHEIPPSVRPVDDFKRWRRERLTAHYEPVRPWCELILRRQMPLSVFGEWQGISMLFPMEKLFERYVESAIRRSLSPGASLTAQAASRFLCTYEDKGFFQLRPDMLVTSGECQWVLDAKWKRLDSASTDNRFGLSQADFYQLFAYGQKYLGGKGQLMLVYPRTSKFSVPLGPFKFSDVMQLWAVPFDLEAQALHLAGAMSGVLFQSFL